MLKENLAMLRNVHGYSQEQTAQHIGISRQAYAKWESGETVPDIEKCAKLAELYGTTIDSLIKTHEVEGVGAILPGPVGKDIWGTVTIGNRGQMVIPKAAREKFNLKAGDRLIVGSDEVGIALIPLDAFRKQMEFVMELSEVAQQ